ncbi:MAG TPA: dihydrodipicolinate synthase family protein [Chloroflexota bacterium]|nr:dihydrodipicolinate synthase family protein [Chloroflexota bacterium]
MKLLEGISPPLVTPLLPDGSLDEPGLRRLIDYVIDGGVHGIVVLGSSGEAALLLPEVRRRVVEVAVDQAGRRVPVVVGTGEPGTALAVQSTRLAQQAGAAGAIVVPPFYYPHDQEAVKRHYRTLRDEVGLPLLAYHIPGMTKVPVEADTLLELAADGTLVGMKDSAGSFAYYQRIVDGTRDNPRFAALQGSDQFLFAGLHYGGDGAISVISQVAPKIMVALYDAARASDWDEARRLHAQWQRVSAAIGPGWIPAIKGAFSALGICGPHVAAPNATWSEDRLTAQRTRVLEMREQGLLEPRVPVAA